MRKRERIFYSQDEVFRIVRWMIENYHKSRNSGEVHPVHKAQIDLERGLSDYDFSFNHGPFARAYMALFDEDTLSNVAVANAAQIARNIYAALYPTEEPINGPLD